MVQGLWTAARLASLLTLAAMDGSAPRPRSLYQQSVEIGSLRVEYSRSLDLSEGPSYVDRFAIRTPTGEMICTDYLAGNYDFERFEGRIGSSTFDLYAADLPREATAGLQRECDIFREIARKNVNHLPGPPLRPLSQPPKAPSDARRA